MGNLGQSRRAVMTLLVGAACRRWSFVPIRRTGPASFRVDEHLENGPKRGRPAEVVIKTAALRLRPQVSFSKAEYGAMYCPAHPLVTLVPMVSHCLPET